jgi:hypothetical protein
MSVSENDRLEDRQQTRDHVTGIGYQVSMAVPDHAF